MNFTRGDTEKFKFQRKDENDKPILTKADEVYFTVKVSDITDKVVFQKRLSDDTITFTDDGYYHFTIEPKDTNNLNYGTYYFDIEVKLNTDNYVKTIKKGNLEITKEITFASNEV